MKKIYNKIDRTAIVSFDIFDTLLKRHVRNPEDVFVLVEKIYNTRFENKISGFKEHRKKAEKEARLKSVREDIDIYEIYSCIEFDDKDRLLALELEVEESLLVLNFEIKDIFDYAKSKDKRIIIVSDMYLPRQFLEKILNKVGIEGYERLFVSSEIGKLKSSGSMFDYVLSELGVEPKEILHIGDALKGDYLVPKYKKIDSFLLNRYVNRGVYNYRLKEDTVERGIINTFINNSEFGGRLFKIGYETLGPMLYGFCQWIHEKRHELGLNKLLFFARDGQLVFNCYQKMYPDEICEYVYFSRRSLTVPLICKLKDKQEILSIIPINRYTEISSLIKRLGISYDENVMLIESFGFKKGQSYHRDFYFTDSNFDELFAMLLPQILDNSQNEYVGLCKYYEKIKSDGKIGLVDIGWKGTIQNAFEKFLSIFDPQTSVYGLYVGIMKNSVNSLGYVFQSTDKQLEDAIVSFAGLFETFFSADHGSVLSYEKEGQVILCPFEYDLDEKARKEYVEIKEIQKGADCFISTIIKNSILNELSLPKEVFFENIKRLGTSPLLEDAKRFGNYYFFDTIITNLAKPNKSQFYSLKKILKDFSNSSWKIAYLKRVLRINMSYLSLYSLIKKIVSKK